HAEPVHERLQLHVASPTQRPCPSRIVASECHVHTRLVERPDGLTDQIPRRSRHALALLEPLTPAVEMSSALDRTESRILKPRGPLARLARSAAAQARRRNHRDEPEIGPRL